MRRFLPFLVGGAVTLCVAAALLAYFLPSISLLMVPSEIKQAVADSLDCGDGACTAIDVRVKRTSLDTADQHAGVLARWCVAYVRIEENTGSYTREFLPWAYQTAKSYRFVLENKHGNYEPVSYGRGSDGDPERYDQYCR